MNSEKYCESNPRLSPRLLKFIVQEKCSCSKLRYYAKINTNNDDYRRWPSPRFRAIFFPSSKRNSTTTTSDQVMNQPCTLLYSLTLYASEEEEEATILWDGDLERDLFYYLFLVFAIAANWPTDYYTPCLMRLVVADTMLGWSSTLAVCGEWNYTMSHLCRRDERN